MQPKYAAVYDELVARIAQLDPGAKLDSELTIARQLDVSPMTVRRALDLLSQEGKTVGVPGRGTFVAAQPKNTARDAVVSAIENAYIFSLQSGELGRATPEEMRIFDLSSNDFVYRIAQLRSDDVGAVGWDLSILRADTFPDLLSEDLTRSVRACLSGAFRAEIYSAHVEFLSGVSLMQKDEDSDAPPWEWFHQEEQHPSLAIDQSYVDECSQPVLRTRTLLTRAGVFLTF